MKRVFLFILTNVAVLLVLSVVLSLLGFDGYLNEQGIQLGPLLLFSAVFGMGGSFISLAMSKWMAKRATGAQVIETPRNPAEEFLFATVSKHARAAGISMPEVAVYDAAGPNAFATGAKKNSALVAVSTGLLSAMNRDEVDAVLGHEISHVANGDMVTMALLQGVLNTFVLFFSRIVGYVVDRVVFKTERGVGPGFYITMIVAQILFSFLAMFIVAWFSRRREFRADAGGARLAGRENMIGALEALGRQNQPAQLPEQLAAFGIRGGGRGFLSALTQTHPPLEERIAALRTATYAE